MTTLTWLHLSDWHHQLPPDFDRKIVLKPLIEDIKQRVNRIDKSLERVDFVIFSGDLAYNGKSSEYEAACKDFLEPIINAVGLKNDRIFIVPGNHDIDRGYIYEMLPKELLEPIQTDELVQKWLIDEKRRLRTLEPFNNFRDFVTNYNGQSTPDYASILQFKVDEKQIALLGLNSAWMSSRNKNNNGNVDDARYLLVGEPQVIDASNQIANTDLRICVLHHPLEWLHPLEKSRIDSYLRRNFHFILHGHDHEPEIDMMQGSRGECVVIPAGACYDRRVATNPRYTNSYNWVHLNFENGDGYIYFRRWSDQNNKWIKDTEALPEEAEGKFHIKPLPKNLGGYPPSTQPSSNDIKSTFISNNKIQLGQINSKRFVCQIINKAELLDLSFVEFPYQNLNDPTDIDVANQVNSRVYCTLWLPCTETIIKLQMQEYTSIVAICLCDVDEVIYKLKNSMSTRGFDNLALNPSKLMSQDKEEIFQAIGNSFSNSFVATVVLPKIMFQGGEDSLGIIYNAMMNNLLLPILQMHRRFKIDFFHLKIPSIGGKKRGENNSQEEMYLVKSAKPIMKAIYKKNGHQTIEICDDQDKFQKVIHVCRFISWAVNRFSNNDENSWLEKLNEGLN